MKIYSFDIEQMKTIIELKFEPGAKVSDAKEKLAAHYKQKYDASYFTLFFAGRELRDTFILDRLRIENEAVKVYIRDTDEILLVTAGALRNRI